MDLLSPILEGLPRAVRDSLPPIGRAAGIHLASSLPLPLVGQLTIVLPRCPHWWGSGITSNVAAAPLPRGRAAEVLVAPRPPVGRVAKIIRSSLFVELVSYGGGGVCRLQRFGWSCGLALPHKNNFASASTPPPYGQPPQD
jgi:hypothetical protein